ncbi:MAG: TRAP transporter small permease subunit [Desulfopila sp.]
MKRLLGAIDALSILSGKASSFLTLPIIFIIMYEVISRYVFNAPTVWASEIIAILCGIYLVMGGAYVLQMDAHVKVDIIYSNFSRRQRTIIDIITSPLILLYLFVIVYTGFIYGIESWEFRETTGTAANMPIYPLKISFFVASFLMTLQMIAKIITDIRRVFFAKEVR